MQLAGTSVLGGNVRNNSRACSISVGQKHAPRYSSFTQSAFSFRHTHPAPQCPAPSCLKPEGSSSLLTHCGSPAARLSVQRRSLSTRTAKQAQQRQGSKQAQQRQVSARSTDDNGSHEAVNTFSGIQQDAKGPTEAGVREIGITVKVHDVNKNRPQVCARPGSLLRHI